METITLTPRQAERFWAKVDKSGECWTWTGAPTKEGYGRYRVGETKNLSHRISYFLANGPLDPALVVDHMCHNTLCVNPQHLQQVTRSMNSQNRQGAMKNSSTGIRGVSWDKKSRKFRAQVASEGVNQHLGHFATIEEAEHAAIAGRMALQTNNLLDRAA